MTREDFIRKGGRIFILALMVSGTGILAFKRRVSLNGTCDDNSRCASCGIKNRCTDPEKQIAESDGRQSS